MPGFRDLPQALRHKIAENLSDEDIIRFAQTNRSNNTATHIKSLLQAAQVEKYIKREVAKRLDPEQFNLHVDIDKQSCTVHVKIVYNQPIERSSTRDPNPNSRTGLTYGMPAMLAMVDAFEEKAPCFSSSSTEEHLYFEGESLKKLLNMTGNSRQQTSALALYATTRVMLQHSEQHELSEQLEDSDLVM
ncbi:hypothetical protein [Piscirickettsia salmonis]|uniref:hypothetical protein n=1 Tax=Piscirickettsia salmonis TaxID=1238 RepID=UPI0007C926E3|nr:hypothetical protein A0O36_02538 [Piscirickettsiaceae bacterium NZ-RLO1]